MPLPNPDRRLMIPLEALSIKMKSGFSPLVCVVGDETGIGKSCFVARSSELIYWRTYNKIWLPINDKEINLFFYMDKFKRELFNAKHRIMIVDEAEIELGSDEWQSIANRWFSRMKSTQRIKGNLYFVVLPMFSLLAKKHRRAVNYIWNVKSRGYADCFKIKKKPAQLLGDDISKFYIGSMRLELPDCQKMYEFYDTENKKLIEQQEGLKYDYDKFRESKKLEKFKQFIEKQNGKFKYECYSCGKAFESEKELSGLVKCPNCKTFITIDNKNIENEDKEDDENENGDGENE